ncbi:iron-sulfur cluster assembly scaffold protein [Erythrobacter litoralis]|uniref:iron-sulfur cluster assembly scaffold protein n=1 Tax=Erythrobacter litoralis TaxID=39960 RepID=UPI002434CD7C|nr:iron-sulfur cluster assembly scaffold protein [Erythrobacter litoralis]MDG6078147.1 iron-sulfur cluster assembly scaffold protein [Erythrobacter litoralis]
MTQANRRALYSQEMLRLSTELADHPFNESAKLKGEARSRACGSILRLSADEGAERSLIDIGLRASTCAVGQASAALFLHSAKGRTVSDYEQALSQIEAWLSGSDAKPEWPGLDAIEAARAYPARHGAIVLPWKAAIDALSPRNQGS